MKRLSSTRLRLAPSPPIFISSSACVTALSRSVRRSVPTARGPPGSAGGGPELFRGPQDRLDDVLVAGAAAEVARQRPAHLFLGRIRVGVQQCLGGHHHPGGAEPALQAVLLLEALLQRVQFAGGGQALHRFDLVPSAWTASIVHDLTAVPSTSTVHAP